MASGAQAVNADGTVPNDFHFAGIGIDENTFHVGAIRVAADGAVMNGNVFLTADTRVLAAVVPRPWQANWHAGGPGSRLEW